jgi:uncharacterized protein
MVSASDPTMLASRGEAVAVGRKAADDSVETVRRYDGLARLPYLVLGFGSLALGLIGAVVPLLPTTVFLLIAVWAFARSCPTLHRALLEHPRLGPPIRNWQERRCLSRRAKRTAVLGMVGSFVLSAVMLDGAALPTAAVGAVLAVLAAYLVTRDVCPA